MTMTIVMIYDEVHGDVVDCDDPDMQVVDWDDPNDPVSDEERDLKEDCVVIQNNRIMEMNNK